MTDYDYILRKLNEYFSENNIYKSLEYSYGYFDAISVIRAIQEEEKLK